MQINIDKIAEILKKANYIYIAGNGGLAAQADHFACDLLKGAKLKAVSLCSNNSLISAIGNDIDYEHVFSKQLDILFNPQKDVLFLMSTSGTSGNIIHAAYNVYKKGGIVISLVGNKTVLDNYSTYLYIITAPDMQICEDAFVIICHKIFKKILD